MSRTTQRTFNELCNCYEWTEQLWLSVVQQSVRRFCVTSTVSSDSSTTKTNVRHVHASILAMYVYSVLLQLHRNIVIHLLRLSSSD